MKIYLISIDGQVVDYEFDKNKAKELKEWYQNLNDKKEVCIEEVNVKKSHQRKDGEIVWINLNDTKERIITAPKDWDETVWFE